MPPICLPSKVTVPSDGRTSPITVLSVVLLPTPLRPEQAHDLARLDVDGDSVEDVGLAVVGVHVVEGEHQVLR